MNLSAVISSYFPSLTKSEQKVAQYVLANPDEIEYHSISELSSLAKVGESTVVRFCRSVGFTGFQEFKMEFVKSQMGKIGEKKPDRDIQGSKNIILEHLKESLVETNQFISEELIEQAVKMIDQANFVCIIGEGNSVTVAQDLKNRLIRFGIKAGFAGDTHIQAIQTTLLEPDDVVLAISTSGKTKGVIANVRLAKECQAKVIAITNYLNSELANEADVSLVCSAKEFISDAGSFSAKISQLYMVDVLCDQLWSENKEKIHALRVKTNRVLVDRIE